MIVFGGDFKQTPHVIPSGSKQDIVNAFLSSSYLWQQCNVHQLYNTPLDRRLFRINSLDESRSNCKTESVRIR